MYAVSTEDIHKTLVVCQPAGAAMDLQPGTGENFPFQIWLLLAVENTVNRHVRIFGRSKPRGHPLHLSPLILWIGEVGHL